MTGGSGTGLVWIWNEARSAYKKFNGRESGKRISDRGNATTFPQSSRSRAAIPALISLGSMVPARGQSDAPPDDPSVTLFPHSQTTRYWISGQSNIIFQWHPSFDAKYSGPNSFRSQAEHATSNVATLFLGLELTHTTEVFVDVEDRRRRRGQRRPRTSRLHQRRRGAQS